MYIIPALDLIDGKAVRLQKGDYDKVTVYSDAPEKVAKYFYDCGAKYLHVVDLDGAKSGKADNFETIKKIVDATDLSVISARIELGTEVGGNTLISMSFTSPTFILPISEIRSIGSIDVARVNSSRSSLLSDLTFAIFSAVATINGIFANLSIIAVIISEKFD